MRQPKVSQHGYSMPYLVLLVVSALITIFTDEDAYTQWLHGIELTHGSLKYLQKLFDIRAQWTKTFQGTTRDLHVTATSRCYNTFSPDASSIP